MSYTPTPTVRQQTRQQSIDYLQNEFRLSLGYVTDAELKSDIIDWMTRSDQLPESTVLDYIERRLSDLRSRDDGTHVSQFDMYRSGDDGTAEFPDACQGCTHYGTRCPVFCGTTQQSQREQLQDELVDEPPARVKNQYRSFAQRNDCHRIPAFIAEYEDRYKDLTREGWELYRRLDTDVGHTDEQLEGESLASDPSTEAVADD
ncbi:MULTISPECIES: hypothetical protein [Halorussus]|uniref:hypothetical protein n=1 Tax=Halorussus TaxID=1070314 RepID=UPI00209DF00E|nr:hypothetical protein [Halorussus vallis]USZ78642.1 hypothetical protein NGM07_25165 [Halorussus vallis]USZ78673.1 hypothetical protein NGM07_24495 [Halorussus vallis]